MGVHGSLANHHQIDVHDVHIDDDDESADHWEVKGY